MRRMFFFIILTAIILVSPYLQLTLCAQSSSPGIAPYNYPSPTIAPDKWILDESKSDEFNGSTLDTSKWWQINPCNDTAGIYHGYNWGPGDFFVPQNVSVSNGNLVLMVSYNPDSLNDSFPCLPLHHNYTFLSGGVVSKITNGGSGLGPIGKYSYGYYEMRAKLPAITIPITILLGTDFGQPFGFIMNIMKVNVLKYIMK